MPDYISPAARERVVQDLAEHFAQDRLTLAEYERRVELALQAPSSDALRDLTRDLTPLAPVPVAGAALPRRESQRQARVVTAPSNVPAVKRFFALMSGVARRGSWTAPADMRAIALMGGIELDLREAILTAPVTEIEAVAVMGGIEITVPPDVRLESDGFAIMGGFEDQLREPATGDSDAPVIRVRGMAIMGGVEVRVRERKG